MHNTPWFSDIFSFVEAWSSFTYLSFIHWWVAKDFYFIIIFFFNLSHLQGNNVIIKLTVTEYIFKPSENLESLWKTWKWWGLWEVFFYPLILLSFLNKSYIFHGTDRDWIFLQCSFTHGDFQIGEHFWINQLIANGRRVWAESKSWVLVFADFGFVSFLFKFKQNDEGFTLTHFQISSANEQRVGAVIIWTSKMQQVKTGQTSSTPALMVCPGVGTLVHPTILLY